MRRQGKDWASASIPSSQSRVSEKAHKTNGKSKKNVHSSDREVRERGRAEARAVWPRAANELAENEVNRTRREGQEVTHCLDGAP